ncbi:AsmA family protein [Methylobacterium segetis]|uniref:AsmA family protein n=1 Tax=Methylobacterium segetis TaxID=2488750 RepID=UPI0010438FDA|nr:AsmA family protein [Methylobacterium segetis]
MSPRRLLPALGLGGLAAAALVAACNPWPVGTAAAARFVSRGLAPYGLALGAEGATEISLLPLPHLRFGRARIAVAGGGGPVLAEGGRLTIELSLLALLSGQAEIGAIALDGATLHLDPANGAFAEPMRRVGERLAQGRASHPRRVAISRATVVGPVPAQDVDLVLSWPVWSASLDCAGSLTVKGVPARFALAGLRPADLVAGSDSPVTLTASWEGGSLAAEGIGTWRDGPRLSGHGSLETRSLPEALAWIGADVALAPFIDRFGLDGPFEASRAGLMLPDVRVSVGSNALEGAVSASFGEARSAVQATLAADSLNLAPLLGGFLRLFGSAGEGEAAGARSVALKPLTGGDLDLRLSAATSRLGPVVLQDLAASVLVRGDTIEASLNRAGLQGGTLKGRVALAPSGADGAETEVKAQGGFDRLDLGALLIDLGQYRWVLGGTQGQFALESVGRDVASLTEHVSGRAAFAIDDGAIAGLDLADVIQRNGGVAQGALARRNGRTAFERAAVSIRFADGVGEIGEGFLRASALSASLRGHVFLTERRFRARAELTPRVAGGAEAPRAGTLFEIAGPWDAVTVRPADREEPAAAPDHRGALPSRGPQRPPAAVGLPPAARAYAP